MGTLKYVFTLGFALSIIACQETPEEGSANKSLSANKFLYVSSGLCYSGFGNTTYTTATSSNVIFRLDATTGQYEGRITDFTTPADSAATSPTSIINYNDTHLLALIEHATLRRIELIEKKLSGQRSIFYNNTSATAPFGALQSALSTITRASDGLLISRSTAIEKIDSSKARISGTGTTGWIQGPGGACSAAATNLTSVITYPTTGNAKGYNIIYTHTANASSATNNRISVIDGATGWNGTAGCLTDVSTVAAGAIPTASVYMKDQKRLVVAYAGTNVALQNSLYTYAVDEAATTNIITDAAKGYETPSSVYGASALAYDEVTGSLYVATGGTAAANLTTGNVPYKIEKFKYDSSTKLFSRVNETSFYSGNIESRCISSMFIGN